MAQRMPSALIRAPSALTALLTAWCLGCSAFEPLLYALNASSAARDMACPSDVPDRESSTGAGAAAGDDGMVQDAASLIDAEGQRSLVCGCEFCAAVSLRVFAFPFVSHPAPHVSDSDAPALVGIERTPLVPPPLRAFSMA